jgi:lipopolysaccharide/colanic/teichoic acid biosynthesis glycosyltransferase
MDAHQLTPSRLGPEHAEPTRLAFARRTADIVLAAGIILLLAPLLLTVALAIRLDSPGPALFRQRRLGRNRHEFTLFKFRSMRVGADPQGHRDYVTSLIRNGNGGSPPLDHGGLYKLAVDDRITRVGRLIRRWSIDELPQLFNVIAGDMTLVGPRPVIPYEVAEYPAWYGRRFAVKPGLTGLWQVSGRSQRTYEEMVRLDIEYAESRSLLLDLSIFAKTPWVVLSRKGAE